MRKLNISSAKILKDGYKFYSKWDDFVKYNKNLIEGYVEKEIKDKLKFIPEGKQRDKKYNEWMQDYKTDLIHTWNKMKT